MTQPASKRLVTEESLTDPDSPAGAQLIATIAESQSQLVVTDATTTASINAWLAAPSGLGAKRLLGSASITAPLVIRSGVLHDFSTATITLAAGSNCNMLQNAAALPVRSITDAAITVGTTALTSATAAFTSADVGRTVSVMAAGGNGAGPLTTKIKTVTNATSVVLTEAATATISGAPCRIYNRDAKVKILGGSWDRGANGGVGNDNHTMFLRHIDGVYVADFTVTSTAGKYSVALGDVTNAVVERPHFETASDGVHITGPATNVVVRDPSGTTQDDMCAITCGDYSAYGDVGGDVTGVSFENLSPDNAKQALRILSGAGRRLDMVTARNILGSTQMYGVWIGGDPGDAATEGGTYGTIEIDNVQVDTPAAFNVLLRAPSIDRLTIRRTKRVGTIGSPSLIGLSGTDTATIGMLQIDDCEAGGTVGFLGGAAAGLTIKQLIFNRPRWRPSGGQSAMYVSAIAAVEDITVRDLDSKGDVASNIFINWATTTPLRRVHASGGVMDTGNKFFQGFPGAPAVTLTFDGGVYKNLNRLLEAKSDTTVVLNGPDLDTIGGGSSLAAIFANSGPLTVKGHAGRITAVPVLINRNGAGDVIHVIGAGLPASLSSLARGAGDICYNTNAPTGGVGVALCDGTTWKNLSSGATY